jgi:hypothetical protein
MTLAMFTHWSPIRSTAFIRWRSAAISRRSVATGAWVASSVRIDWWTVLNRLDRLGELARDEVEPLQRAPLEVLELLLVMDPDLARHQPTLPVT